MVSATARWMERNPTPQTIAAFDRLEQAAHGSTPWATAASAVRGGLKVQSGPGGPRSLEPHPVGGRRQVTDKDRDPRKGYGPRGKSG